MNTMPMAIPQNTPHPAWAALILSGASFFGTVGCENKPERPAPPVPAALVRPSSAPATQALTVNELMSALRKFGWQVREGKQLGSSIVVVFSDEHSWKSSKRHVEELEQLRAVFPFEIIGLESVIGRPESEPSTRLMRNYEQIMSGNPDATAGLATPNPVLEPFRPLYLDNRFKALGVESDSAVTLESQICVGIEKDLISLQRAVEQRGSVTIRSQGRTNTQVRRALNGINYLRKAHADFPGLDLSKSDVLGQAELPRIEGFIDQLEEWYNLHILPKRNEGIAAKLINSMEAPQKLTRGALVIGLTHTIPSSVLPGQLPIQEHLALHNISYIIVDFDKISFAAP